MMIRKQKKNNYQIGDFVRMICSGLIFKITEINRETIRLVYDESDCGEWSYYVTETDIEPISVTPYLLRRNGFVSNRKRTYWRKERENYDVTLHDFGLMPEAPNNSPNYAEIFWLSLCVKKNNEIKETITLSRERGLYVHEIQQALRFFNIKFGYDYDKNEDN